MDLDLVGYAASKGKPLILSTGMASAGEVRAACSVAQDVPTTILNCVSAYPASPNGVLSHRPWWPVVGGWGVSDHTHGIGVSVAAVAMGASSVEKHLTLSRANGGPDAGFSLEPDEFAQLVIECRRAYRAVFSPRATEQESDQRMFRRSLWWAADLPKGRVVRYDDVQASRPAYGLPCDMRAEIVGQRLVQDVKRGTPVGYLDLHSVEGGGTIPPVETIG